MRLTWTFELDGLRDACLVDQGVVACAASGVWRLRRDEAPNLLTRGDLLSIYPGVCNVHAVQSSPWDSQHVLYCLGHVEVGRIALATGSVEPMRGAIHGLYYPDLYLDPNGERILAVTELSFEWDVRSRRQIGQHRFGFPSCARPDGGLYVTTEDSQVLWLDPAWQVFGSFRMPAHYDALRDAELAYLATGLLLSTNERLSLLDPAHGEVRLEHELDGPAAVAAAPDGKALVVVSRGRAQLFDEHLSLRAELPCAYESCRLSVDSTRALLVDWKRRRGFVWDLTLA